MPSIDIKRAHSRSLAEAKSSVQRVADHIARKFDVACSWDGNTLDFKRSGVNGQIKVSHRQIHVTADLGFLLMGLRASVEREINRYLEEEFG
ncbi:MAG: polyhydroxyalkanoic acid system family protein [Arenimonas sp.]